MFPNVTALFDMDLEKEYQRIQEEEKRQDDESVVENKKAKKNQ